MISIEIQCNDLSLVFLFHFLLSYLIAFEHYLKSKEDQSLIYFPVNCLEGKF